MNRAAKISLIWILNAFGIFFCLCCIFLSFCYFKDIYFYAVFSFFTMRFKFAAYIWIFHMTFRFLLGIRIFSLRLHFHLKLGTLCDIGFLLDIKCKYFMDYWFGLAPICAIYLLPTNHAQQFTRNVNT